MNKCLKTLFNQFLCVRDSRFHDRPIVAGQIVRSDIFVSDTTKHPMVKLEVSIYEHNCQDSTAPHLSRSGYKREPWTYSLGKYPGSFTEGKNFCNWRLRSWASKKMNSISGISSLLRNELRQLGGDLSDENESTFPNGFWELDEPLPWLFAQEEEVSIPDSVLSAYAKKTSLPPDIAEVAQIIDCKADPIEAIFCPLHLPGTRGEFRELRLLITRSNHPLESNAAYARKRSLMFYAIRSIKEMELLEKVTWKDHTLANFGLIWYDKYLRAKQASQSTISFREYLENISEADIFFDLGEKAEEAQGAGAEIETRSAPIGDHNSGGSKEKRLADDLLRENGIDRNSLPDDEKTQRRFNDWFDNILLERRSFPSENQVVTKIRESAKISRDQALRLCHLRKEHGAEWRQIPWNRGKGGRRF